MELETRRQEASWLEDKEERDVVSPWDVPLEIRRILGQDGRAKEQVCSNRWFPIQLALVSGQKFHQGCSFEMTKSVHVFAAVLVYPGLGGEQR